MIFVFPLTPFWQEVCDFIAKNIDDQFVLLWKDLLFGLREECKDKCNKVYIIHFILLMAKFHIHKCKKKLFYIFQERNGTLYCLYIIFYEAKSTKNLQDYLLVALNQMRMKLRPLVVSVCTSVRVPRGVQRQRK